MTMNSDRSGEFLKNYFYLQKAKAQFAFSTAVWLIFQKLFQHQLGLNVHHIVG